MSFAIKNGTPVSTEPLCHWGRWVHMQRGFRDSEVLVFCAYGTLRPVPFPAPDCTDCCHRAMPAWQQREDLALPIDGVSAYKPAGFLIGVSAAEDEGD